MSEPASISSGIADRYAKALFELSKESKSLDSLASGVDDLAAALDGSAELREVIASPVISRTEQQRAIAAVGAKMGLDQVLQNGLALMAQKRRLFVLPQLIVRLRDMIAADRGEVSAEVVSAKALTKEQAASLAKTLKERVGKDINLKATVDESIIGGLIVKVGSQMIDTSIRSRLNSLQNAMKEVG